MKKSADLKTEVGSRRKAHLKSKPSLIGEAKMGTLNQWLKELKQQEAYDKVKVTLSIREFLYDYVSK